jgi:hypothetical protein
VHLITHAYDHGPPAAVAAMAWTRALISAAGRSRKARLIALSVPA